MLCMLIMRDVFGCHWDFFFVAAKVQQFQQSWLGTGKVSEGPLNETAACDAARFLQKVSVSSLGRCWRSCVLPRLCWTSWRTLCPWRVPKGRKVGVFWLLTPFHALKKEMITAVQTWLYFHRTQRGGFRRNNFKAAKERITPQWPPLVCWNPRLFAAHWSWQTCQLKVLAAGRALVRFQFHQTQKISKAFVAATPIVKNTTNAMNTIPITHTIAVCTCIWIFDVLWESKVWQFKEQSLEAHQSSWRTSDALTQPFSRHELIPSFSWNLTAWLISSHGSAVYLA